MAQPSMEKLEHTGLAEKERIASVPQREQLTSMPNRPCQKEKKQSRLSKTPNRDVGESQDEREPHIGEREGGAEWKHREERVDYQVKEGRFRGEEGGKARRASLGKVEGSMSG